MLYDSQKRFDKNGDGKLTGAEWQRWYWRTFGDEIEAKERSRRNQAAEQQRAEIAAQFVGQAVSIINWMWRDLEHLEGEREDQDIRTMQLALYVISAAMQTQKVDESMRYLLRAFWQSFYPTLGESVYQALCAKQLLFEEYGVISETRLGSFWKGLLDELPRERRVGKDTDLQELLNDASRLYNYFGTTKIDFAEEIEPYWAAIRLPEETEEPEEYDEDEEPEEAPEPWTEYYEKEAPAEESAGGGYYQFCKVQFKENGAGYAYLTGGLSLKAGDFVIVPVGPYGAEKLARVTEVFVCTEQDAPYPPEKTKFVLRQAAETAFPKNGPHKKVPPVPAASAAARGRDASIPRPESVARAAGPDAPAGKRPAAKPGPVAASGAEQPAQERACARRGSEEKPAQPDRAQGAGKARRPAQADLPGPILDTLPQPVRLKEPAGKAAAFRTSKTVAPKAAVPGPSKTVAPKAAAREASESPRGAGAEAAAPNGARAPKRRWQRWVLLAAALGVFLFVLLRPAPETKPAVDPDWAARWEAEQEAEQRAKEAEIQAMRDAGLPYVGMPESEIGTTPVLGSYGVVQHILNHNTGWEGRLKRTRYLWFTTGRELIFTAICLNGYVSEVQEESGYWRDHTLLVPVVKPDTYPTYYYNDDDDSGSLRDEYDSPEDLYEENPDDYEDLDDAWDAWEND